MTPAAWSLAALALVIAASVGTRLNVGLLALALAWPVATLATGWTTGQLLAAFPSSLFVTLLGVTLLFGAAQANGTIGALAQRALHAAGGRVAWMPLLFFALACALSTLGPGAIAAVALLAPLAMSIGRRAGLSPLLIALMVCNGANAGNLSPFSSVGVIVADGMAKAGVPGHEWRVWAANFAAHALAATAAWWMFGGRAAFRSDRREALGERAALTRAQVTTLCIGAAWIAAVTVGGAPLGPSAFVAVTALLLLRGADERAMLAEVPWSVLVLVCGVSVLVAVLEGSGGMSLFTDALAAIATERTVNGAMAFITGLISTYSSTSGVIYPTFLPAIPELVSKLGGGDPLQIALSINVGAALVDVSPISTLGALCVAALPVREDARTLFRQLLLWGFAMTVVGAVFCQLLVPFFAA